MRKLISANFIRLWKSKTFWIEMLFILVSSLIMGVIWGFYRTREMDTAGIFYVENVMFNSFSIFNMVLAIFIGLFVGTEYEYGVIRNKISVGHTRNSVFFSDYVLCISAALIQLFTMIGISGVIGLILFQEFFLDWIVLPLLMLGCVLIVISLVTIDVAVGMNIDNKAVSTVIIIVLNLFLSVCASSIESILPYLGEDTFVRTIVEFFFNLLPTGQITQICSMKFDNVASWPLLSMFLITIVLFAGLRGFKKKDIR